MLLNGFGFSGYRSFGNELALIAPLKKINFIVGQNNSGKSNIIKFLDEQSKFFLAKAIVDTKESGFTENALKSESEKKAFKELDIPRQVIPKYSIAFTLPLARLEDFVRSKIVISHGSRDLFISLAKKALIEKFSIAGETLLFIYSCNSLKEKFELQLPTITDHDLEYIRPIDWKNLGSAFNSNSDQLDLIKQLIPSILRSLSFYPNIKDWPNIKIISAIRQVINSDQEEPDDFNGKGLIIKLAMIQNPPFNEQEKKKKFESINKFLQTVLENASARIEIPHGRDMILVHMDGKTLPLESLGTGVHEVIIIAAAATLLNKTVVCIEEPELHLHPILQRKLIGYLSQCTDNQYFFTTHSAHLLDAVDDVSIFHVTLKNGQSHVETVSTTKQKSEICKSLGYKASDLLQTNCIIWVEGPTDRAYINYWLKGKRSDLVEGIHYSIMFYGGRLASHLTALDIDEQEKLVVEDFIKLRSLNRNAVIVMDSDKQSSHARVNTTKKRLQDEFNKGPGFAWITKGREIENYLNENALESCIKQVHPESFDRLESKGQWANLLKFTKKASEKKREKKSTKENIFQADKVKVAEYYIKNNKANYDKLDLKAMIDKLIAFIEECNGKK